MSLKMPFLDFFPVNLDAVRDEQGEHFHQLWKKGISYGKKGVKAI